MLDFSINIKSDIFKRVFDECIKASKYVNLKPYDQDISIEISMIESPENLLKKLKIYNSFLQNIVDLDDPKEIMSFVEKSSNIYFPDCFLKTIEKESDVLEVYNIQTFSLLAHNKKFSDLNSYSIFDLFAHPFYVLYDREKGEGDVSFDSRFMELAQEAERLQKTLGVDIPQHQIKERYKDKNKIFLQKHKWISPGLPNKSTDRVSCFAITHELFPRKIIQRTYSN